MSMLILTALLVADSQPPKPAADKITALIDKLTEIDRQDAGYSGSMTGSSFLPLGESQWHMGLLFQSPRSQSETMTELVRLGAAAVPKLLEHLDDARQTKIVLEHEGHFGGMYLVPDEPDGNNDRGTHQTKYTLMVGDLCYVALGQIVSRNYWAMRYQPTAIIYVTSLPKSPKLRETVRKEWSALTARTHRDSLLKDLASGREYSRNAASIRLAYYYPDAMEAAALKELAKPTYDVFKVHEFVRNKLYPAASAKERKTLTDEFVAEQGEIARDGIRWLLFKDLSWQIAVEEGRSSAKSTSHRARECLIEIFGLTEKVKVEDAPDWPPLSATAQARFVQTLHYDRSEKLDRALLDLLTKTSEDGTAKGCLDRLVGRGYDAEIEAYLKRRLKEPRPDEFQPYVAKLGWTRLHAAVDLGLAEYVAAALTENVNVDAKDRSGRTALHLAASRGKSDLVAALIDAKADPNVKDEKGRLPVQLAAHSDHAECVRRLVAAHSEVPDVFTAAIVGNVDRVTAILNLQPAAVKQVNDSGFTPLHVAAREGQEAAVRKLVAAGADVSAADVSTHRDSGTNEWTPLHLAALSGRAAASAVLLEAGADVNAKDRRGRFTPLHYAAWQGSAEVVKVLLANKADRNAEDEQHRTPLALARERKHDAVIRLLERE